jgi:Na+-transporting NADH:ubiquinone oxidoreductase subunit NqrC
MAHQTKLHYTCNKPRFDGISKETIMQKLTDIQAIVFYKQDHNVNDNKISKIRTINSYHIVVFNDNAVVFLRAWSHIMATKKDLSFVCN